jgi:MOSC domain-containing protein YiiM
MSGTLVAIHVALEAAGRMEQRLEARAVAGRGLEGDRYFKGEGTFSKHPGTGRQVTLIAIEMLELVERERGIRLNPAETRRNLLTRGVPLHDLVGHVFRVGPVRLQGIRLAEPCDHLERLTVQGVKEGFIHRAGLRADIIDDGVLRVGDEIAFTATERASP